MVINKETLYKFLTTLLLVVVVLLFFKLLSVRGTNNSLEKQYKKQLKQQIEKSEAKIKKYELEIQAKKIRILQLEVKQVQYEHSLDSLKAVKEKIRTVYKEKIVRVNGFNSIEIEDYWKNKFSSEF